MPPAKRLAFWTAALFLTLASAYAQSTSVRDSFLELIERPKVPLAPVVRKTVEGETKEGYHFTFASEAAQRLPGIIVKPKSAAKLPVVIVLHGTGGTKDGQQKMLNELSSRGFFAVAIDGRYHGERTKTGSGSAEYREAILRRYRTGKEFPFLYDTVWDVMRLVDWLETRSDVDATRIGLIGFSKGGMETYLAAAVDPRIRVAVPCIGVQSFRWALEHEAWQSRVETFQSALNAASADAGNAKIDGAFVRRFYDRVAPGIYSDFDGPAMLPLIAPRPLLVINGDSDARTPLPGLMECVNAAKSAYSKKAAADRFEFLLQEKTGHQVKPESLQKAVAWFERWLRPM
jgi:dienelactone hydrolase